VAVVDVDGDADAGTALVALGGAARYVVRPERAAAAPPPAGVQVVSCAAREPTTIAARVSEAARADVVIVLAAHDAPTPALAAALAAIDADGPPAAFVAACVHRFLGRDVAGVRRAIAWRGDPGAAATTVVLPGHVVVAEPDITTAIARLDRAATIAAGDRASVGVGDFVARPVAALPRRLWIRRRDGVAGFVLSMLETYGDVLTAAKVWERDERAAARRTAP